MKTTSLLIGTLFFINMYGQNPSLDVREILVQKEYNNEIYEVNPLFDYAAININPKNEMNFFKDSLSRISAFAPDIDVTIRPVPYKTIPEDPGYDGFIKLDKGIVNPIHTQAGYSYAAKNYFNLQGSFDYDHRSEDNVTQKYIKTLSAKVGMEYYLTKEIKTEVELKFDRNRYGLYGSHDLLEEEEGSGTNGYQTIKVNIGLQSFKSSPSKWNYGIQSQFAHWKGVDYTGSERNIIAKSWVAFRINELWSMRLNPQYKASLGSAIDDKDLLAGSYDISYNTARFYAKTGIQLDYINKEVQLWPSVDVRWNVSSTTDIDIRSLTDTRILGTQQITAINPYQSVAQFQTFEKVINYNKILSLKVSSTIIDDVDLEMTATYLKATNELNFTINPGDIRTFTHRMVDYERLRLSLGAQKRLITELLTAGLSIQYDKYAKVTEVLYHRPTFTVNSMVQSQLFNNKLQLTLSALVHNPQTLDSVPAAVTQSEWRKDLSFGLSFRMTDQLKINFDADNILNNKYQVWRGYDNFGRNLSGGILFKF